MTESGFVDGFARGFVRFKRPLMTAVLCGAVAMSLQGCIEMAVGSAVMGTLAATDRRTVAPDRVMPPASPYVLQAGAVIPAALITGIRSDLPGQIAAQVTVLTSMGRATVVTPDRCAPSIRVSNDRIGTTASNVLAAPSSPGASATVRSPSTVGLSSSSPTG